MTFSIPNPMTSVETRAIIARNASRVHRALGATAAALATIGLLAGTAESQQPTAGAARVGASVTLSLDEALRIAQTQSQTLEVARSGVVRASGLRLQARSGYFPQLNGTAGYTKTLKSQFSSFTSGSTAPDTSTGPQLQSLCAPNIPAGATPEQRAAALAQAATCQSSGGGGFDLKRTSFGATNQWALGLTFSQNVFTGGRLTAQNNAADAQLRSANIEVAAQHAQVALDVTSAYYDAALADQLVAIADSSLAQTDAVLAQTRVARQVGNTSEYELLRAQVTHDNQLPVAIQARANRQVAYLRLKQLLNLSLDDSVQLTTRIEEPSGPSLPTIAASATVDTSVSDRAPVRQLDETIRAQEAQVRIARAERIPSLSIVSNYQRLYFPANVFPQLSNGVNNWTVGVSTSFPVLDGGRIKGDQLVAEAGLRQARAQREQTRQFAALDTRVALNALQEAQSTWDASRGTADQAQRAYAIDQVRFREGISTQTDLAQSRLLLEQALANRAQAARNLAVARVRLALLRDLPLQAGSGTAASAQGAAGAVQQQQQQQQQQTQQRTGTSASSAGPGGPTGGGGIQP
ncbi:MAG TPA: TolC family protein [Gemmatimonadaceae bacterium]|nr:TolC family protein [Gemmatimonadaceae bacterium]